MEKFVKENNYPEICTKMSEIHQEILDKLQKMDKGSLEEINRNRYLYAKASLEMDKLTEAVWEKQKTCDHEYSLQISEHTWICEKCGKHKYF